MKTSTKKKTSIRRKKPLFGKDGYQSRGPNMNNLEPLTEKESKAVGKALGRGPEPTIKGTFWQKLSYLVFVCAVNAFKLLMLERIGNYGVTMSSKNRLLEEAAKELGVHSIRPADPNNPKLHEVDKLLSTPSRRNEPKKRSKKERLS